MIQFLLFQHNFDMLNDLLNQVLGINARIDPRVSSLALYR